MRSLSAAANLRLLHLDEIANTRLFSDVSARAQPRKRPQCGAFPDDAVFDDARVANRHVVFNLNVLHPGPRLNRAARTDATEAFDDDLWMNDRVLTNLNISMNVSRSRIDDGHAGKHQLTQLAFA